ncbi:MAG: dihydropteroate synthase [Deltaproteobacteria bacterium]|nr:dihydropteroate synthase [Deltaproteobacteria bacterium]
MRIGTYTPKPGRSTLFGILNVTPDSFFDGGQFLDPKQAAERALELHEEGADVIDIGGESTRPFSDAISVEEELRRVIPVIEAIRMQSTLPISIDTRKAEVAKQALGAGANMVNDVSAGLNDSDMFSVVAKARVPICLMHMRGTPPSMQQDTVYNDVVAEVGAFLKDRKAKALAAGIENANILIDPGIGFGKSPEGNLALLQKIELFQYIESPILVGTSRKSFIGKLLGYEVKDRLEPGLATLSYVRRKGVEYFRIHDVAATRRYLNMVDRLEAA